MPKKEIAQQGPAKNPFIVFNPPMVDARALQSGNQTTSKTLSPNPGDGPPIASQAAETLGKIGKNGRRIPTRPGDSINMFMREQEEGEAAIRRYLLKRRMDWFYRIDESTDVKLFCEKLEEFIEYVSSYLALENVPDITLRDKIKGNTFAVWSNKGIEVAITERHPMDVFRSVAHELVHQKQHEDDVLHSESGETGSDHENEANALAGIIMRNFAKNNPKLFELESIVSEGLVNMMFGKEKTKTNTKTKPNSLETLHAKADLERLKHKHRLELISAKSKAASQKVKKAAPVDDDDDEGPPLNPKFAWRNRKTGEVTPERIAQLASFHKRQLEKTPEKQAAHHQAWLDTNKKFPIKKTPPGVKPFSHILKLKEALALLNKSNKSNIPYGVLREVYFRGYNNWSSNYNITKEQFAFNRVDSFIAGGLARKIDKDLEEQING